MYTRCPSCSSTFRVTAAILQMAAGEVRCGACGGVFNALETLVDDWSGTDVMRPGAPRLSHPAAPPGEPPADAPAGATSPVDAALEFNVPENEWQRFFLTPQDAAQATPPRAEPALGDDFDQLVDPESAEPSAPEAAATAAVPADAAVRPVSLDEETADTDTWQGFLREAGLVATPAEADGADAGDDAAAEADAEPADEAPLFILGDEAGHAEATLVMVRTAAPPEAPGDGMPPDGEPGRDAEETGQAPESATAPDAEPDVPAAPGPDPAQDIEAGDPAEAEAGAVTAAGAAPETVLDWGPPPPFSTRKPVAPGHASRWFAASLLAALALGAQLLHYFRDELAASPAYGAAVRAAYGRLGLPLDPDWPLGAYEIRSVKALVENSPQGALDIVAEIAVTGSQPVGLPMLRVVLRDRWSNTVASGVFSATEYLAEAPPASAVYAPGTLIPVQISLKDPGTAAQGYELDVCMPNRQFGLQCKTAREPFRR